MLCPATPPDPMASSRPRRGPRNLSLPTAAWLGAGALAVGFLACLLTLISIHYRLELLCGELSQLRGELMAQMSGTPGDGRGTPEPRQRTGNPLVTHTVKEKPRAPLERRKRELGKTSPEPPRPRISPSPPPGKQSVLHLVPDHQSNSDEGDATEIWWKPFLQQGRALEPSGRDVVVKHTGLYFVYSQVLFNDPTFTMGQMLQRTAPGRTDQILFRCIQSMPPDPKKAYNSCYSGGVFHLQHGDHLNLRIPRFNASLDVSADGTFLGLLRL